MGRLRCRSAEVPVSTLSVFNSVLIFSALSNVSASVLTRPKATRQVVLVCALNRLGHLYHPALLFFPRAATPRQILAEGSTAHIGDI